MNMMGGLGPLISQPLMPWMIGLGFSWPVTIAVLTSGWFIAALAWLRIDASEPLFPEPEEADLEWRRTGRESPRIMGPLPEEGIKE